MRRWQWNGSLKSRFGVDAEPACTLRQRNSSVMATRRSRVQVLLARRVVDSGGMPGWVARAAQLDGQLASVRRGGCSKNLVWPFSMQASDPAPRIYGNLFWLVCSSPLLPWLGTKFSFGNEILYCCGGPYVDAYHASRAAFSLRHLSESRLCKLILFLL